MSATERTPLRPGSDRPSYVFIANPSRVHRQRVRQFQCCICAAVLGVFVTALIVAISYSMNHDGSDSQNGTIPDQNSSLTALLANSWPIPDAGAPSWPVAAPAERHIVQAALAAGREDLNARAALEANLTSLHRDSPSFRANRAVRTRPEVHTLAQQGTVEELATVHLLKKSGATPLVMSALGRGPRLEAEDEQFCVEEKERPCLATPYRTADGTCNNRDHSRSWGVAMRPFRRVMPALYEDGVSKARSSGLPSAREVSVKIHRPLYRNDPDFTVMLAVWGQFVDHDMTATALSQGPNGTAISCCGSAPRHPECFPVPLGDGDPYFNKYNVTCMEFVRSAPAPTCSLGPREQLNQASSFLDGSVVYGPTSDLMQSLRQYEGGRLKMSVSSDGRELLPLSKDLDDGCNREEMNKRGRYCFLSGDGRANENLHLTTMHLLWARQHNQLADRLHQLNPHWNDEKLFQEARRIVGAQLQHITYKEFLPVLLGPRLMSHLELNPSHRGYYEGYDPEVDPTICNSFAASSFRFAHTLLPGLLKLIENDTSSPEFIELHKMLFDPYTLYSSGGVDRALQSAMETTIERADNYFNPELTERLFVRESVDTQPSRSIGHGSAGHPACGLDLVSLNVQRGRDHGLPTYPAWREHCGFQRPTSWSDLHGVIDEDSLQRLQEIYKSVDDVDVYTGSLSEYPLEGGLLGGTVTCMLTDQFVRLKRGDRFWYETSEQPQAFTPEQLNEIRKTTLASIICSTSDGIHSAQPEVMRRAKDSNDRVPCVSIPRPNLRAWTERDGNYTQWTAKEAKLKSSLGQETTAEYAKKDTTIPEVLPTSVRLGDGDVTGKNLPFWSKPDWNIPPEKKQLIRMKFNRDYEMKHIGLESSSWLVTAYPGTLWSKTWEPATGAIMAVPTSAVDRDGCIRVGVVRWSGSFTFLPPDEVKFDGQFVFPEQITTGPFGEFSSKWWKGNFSFTSRLLWNESVDGLISTGTKYSSPVYFKSAPSLHNGSPPIQFIMDSPDELQTPNRVPIILQGEFSKDRTLFHWSGKALVSIPVPKIVEINTVPPDG